MIKFLAWPQHREVHQQVHVRCLLITLDFLYFNTGLWKLAKKAMTSESSSGELTLLSGSEKQKTLIQKSWCKIIFSKALEEISLIRTFFEGPVLKGLSKKAWRHLFPHFMGHREFKPFFFLFWATSSPECVTTWCGGHHQSVAPSNSNSCCSMKRFYLLITMTQPGWSWQHEWW